MRPVGSKYLLEEPLGRGATGTVWRARQRETAGAEAAVAGQPGETVAIKVLKEELANDADVVMRFLRERSVLLRLTHPNIVRTRDLVVEGDLLALVMDLIDGPDLHRYLRENGPLTPVAASLLTAQIADALAASHSDGVVHRDLKPANVLLDERDGGMTPMLTDFGIARLADSPGLTRTHEFVGTPAYVAPESAEGRPQTSAVDIYGAGILLYELVTGRPPFAGGTALEVLHRHLSEEPRRPSTVPEPLWTVIERCLSKDPDRRPSAENLARALRTVAAGVGVHANSAQIAAAEGVGALLAPDPAPTAVPETPGAADPTQVLPSNAGSYDPAAATSVLPQSGPGGNRGPGQPGPRRPDRRHAARAAAAARRAAGQPAPLAVPAPGRPRPQRADAGAVPGPQPGPAAPPPPAPGAPAASPAPAAPAAAPAAPAAAAPAAVPGAAAPATAAPAPALPGAPAAPAAAVRAPAAATPAASAARRAPAARTASAEAAQRQPDAHPRARLPQGLPVHRGAAGHRRLAHLGADPLQDWVAQGKGYWEAIGDAIGKVTDWISQIGEATGESGGGTGGA